MTCKRIETLAFANGAEYSADEVSGNLRPQLKQPSADQQARNGHPWRLIQAGGRFVECNSGDALAIGGKALLLAA